MLLVEFIIVTRMVVSVFLYRLSSEQLVLTLYCNASVWVFSLKVVI